LAGIFANAGGRGKFGVDKTEDAPAKVINTVSVRAGFSVIAMGRFVPWHVVEESRCAMPQALHGAGSDDAAASSFCSLLRQQSCVSAARPAAKFSCAAHTQGKVNTEFTKITTRIIEPYAFIASLL